MPHEPGTSLHDGRAAARSPWWRGGTIYQIYPRSFLDTNGDGVGDLPGVTARLDHVASLGVNSIWLSPFYTSPMADFGYDVADHTAVDPSFGTLRDFDALADRARVLGLRVIVDLVAGHTSDQHAWFRESRRSRSGPKGDWYVWADPQGDGAPPNNWLSVFSGPAWTWEPRRRQYYLHHFLQRQPTLNLRSRSVRDALLDIGRFWLDRGASGLRLDAIDFLAHDPDLRSNPPSGMAPAEAPAKLFGMQSHIHDMLHDDGLAFLHELRVLADERGAVLLGEVSSQPGAFDRVGRYTGPSGPLHTAYTLAPMRCSFDHALATKLVKAASAADAGICWAFSNHDTMRVASRWCAEQGRVDRRKVELVAAFQIALRGELCLYQGDELGLPEAELRGEELRDPFGIAFWPDFKGRDGSRTPIPWTSDQPALGFSDGTPWLPVQASHASLAVDQQDGDPTSILAMWRDLMDLRQRSPELRFGDLLPLALPAPVVGFLRRLGPRCMLCLFNLSEEPVVATVEGLQIELPGWGFSLEQQVPLGLQAMVQA